MLKCQLYTFHDNIYASCNQRLGGASEDDGFLSIWVMKDLGKGFVFRNEICPWGHICSPTLTPTEE